MHTCVYTYIYIYIYTCCYLLCGRLTWSSIRSPSVQAVKWHATLWRGTARYGAEWCNAATSCQLSLGWTWSWIVSRRSLAVSSASNLGSEHGSCSIIVSTLARRMSEAGKKTCCATKSSRSSTHTITWSTNYIKLCIVLFRTITKHHGSHVATCERPADGEARNLSTLDAMQ